MIRKSQSALVLLVGAVIGALLIARAQAETPTSLPDRAKLVYEVTEPIGSGLPPAMVVINLLKKSLDPTGKSNLEFRAVGHDRLEITVPKLPASRPDRLDVDKVKRLLAQPARLEFHMAATADEVRDSEKIVAGLADGLDVPGGKLGWFETPAEIVAKNSQVVTGKRGDKTYLLCWITPEKSMVQTPGGKWRLAGSRASKDQ